MNDKLRNELAKHVRNKNYEPTGQGIFVPKAKLLLGGFFGHNVYHADGSEEGWLVDPNVVVDEGLDHVLDVVFHGETQVDPWYVGIFEGDYTPDSDDTAANITSNSTESTAYDESTRVEYEEAAADSQSITNSANTADFTINDTKTIYGAFLVSASAKSATTGTLMAASRFSASRPVVATDVLSITYTISAEDA